MIAIDRRTRSYPVLMPDRRLRERPSPAPRRRSRRSSLVGTVVLAALIIIPALTYVFQRTEAASTGYAILRLQHEIARIENENDRLHLMVSALSTPQRIERIARTDLGMIPPQQAQLAAITLPPQVVASPQSSGPVSFVRRLGELLGLTEAQAQERE